MYARATGRRADGLVRRLVRGLLQLRASQTCHHRECRDAIERTKIHGHRRHQNQIPRTADRNGARRRRQGQPQTSRRIVRSASFWFFPGPAWRCRPYSNQRHTNCHDHGQFRGEAFAFSRWLHRRAGHQRHRERSRRVGCARRSDRRHLRSGSGIAHRNFGSGSSRHGPTPRKRRVSRSPAATPKSSSTARPTACTSPRPESGACSPASKFRRSPCAPATRFCSPARSAITASRSCWRAEISIWKPSCARTPAPFFRLLQALVREAGAGVRWMRDPTRGGVATSLNELARDCGLGIALFEEKIPVRDSVRGACELLGLDPLHIANEGQFLAIVSAEHAECRAASSARDARRRRSSNDRRSSRTAGERRISDDSLRRKPPRGHAGRRSSAPDLLGSDDGDGP